MTDTPEMTSNRPYMVRAMYQWICDNDMTPHLVVDASVAGVDVPPQTIDNGKVVLNVAPRAVQGLELGNDQVTFRARFNARPHAISIPAGAIIAIYARENGQGMMFPDTEESETGTSVAESDKGEGKSERGSHLRVVK